MASDEKFYNKKVRRLVETDDFDIKIVLIQGRMQKLQPKLCAAALHGRVIQTGVQIIRPGAENFTKTKEEKSWSQMIWVMSRMIQIKAGQSGQSSGQLFLLQTLESGPKHPQDGLKSKSVQQKSCASHRGGWFRYENHLNTSSYAKVTAGLISCCHKTGLGRIIRALSQISGPEVVNSPYFIRFWWFGRLGKSFFIREVHPPHI